MNKVKVEKSCSNCACYYLNTDGEIREIMDNAQTECSLERNPVERVCDFWQERNKRRLR